MKQLLLVTLGLALAIVGQTQTVNQYIKTADKLIRYYNHEEIDSLSLLLNFGFSRQELESLKGHYGQVTIQSFMLIDSTDFDTQQRPMAYFKTTCTKEWLGSKTQALAFSLTADNKIFGIRFMTKSPRTDSLLNRY